MNNPLQDFRPESLCLLKESQEDFWRYGRKEPPDFSIYSEKSSIYEPPIKVKFRENSDVLVRWTDGLLYLATIIQVEEEYSRCAVKFEDGSQFWALYKDIYKGPLPDGEIACTVCDSDSSSPPDEIVICDQCSVGYHQLCHIPKIDSSVLNTDVSWSCRKCIFASAAKKGGALKSGTDAKSMMLMKKTLPYDPQALTWDSSHRSNLQQTYCYCGGPGEWYSKMLQCSRCKQWCHEACIQCLDEPLLFGDRFYIFVCSVCNCGPEFVRRLPIKWPDIAHLVLFNLTIIHGRKFFDLDSSIMSFLKDNWSQFILKGESTARLPLEEKKKNMEEVLHKSKSRFCSGKELKKKTYVWGLRSRVPPPVPAVYIPKSGVINDAVLDSFDAVSHKPKHPVVKSVSASTVKRKRKNSVQYNDESLDNDSDEKSSKSERYMFRELVKDLIDTKNKDKRKLPIRRSHDKRKHRARTRTRSNIPVIELSDSEDTFSSLNSIIPHPSDFEGSNNPFINNYKLSDQSESNMSSNSSSTSSKITLTSATSSKESSKRTTASSQSSTTVSSKSSIASTDSSSTSSRSFATLTDLSSAPLKSMVPTIPLLRSSSTSKNSNSSATSISSLVTPACDKGTSKYTFRARNSNVSKDAPSPTNSSKIAAKDNLPSSTRTSSAKSNLLSDNLSSSNKNSSIGRPKITSNLRKITSSEFKKKLLARRKSIPTLRRSTLSATLKSLKKVSSPTPPSTSKITFTANHRLRLRVRVQQKTVINQSQSMIEGLLNNPCSESSASTKSTPASLPSSACDLNSSLSSYFGASERMVSGEKYTVLAKRVAPNGSIQYLVEWENPSPS